MAKSKQGAEQQAPKQETAGLVAMTKGEEEIDVHPMAVSEHEHLGWKVKGGD